MQTRKANLSTMILTKDLSLERLFSSSTSSYVSCNKALFRLLILIVGFTCLPTIHFKFITKCDSLFYYKVRQPFLFQSATTVITKCDRTPSCKDNFFFGFILVLRTRLAEFILETNYLSRRIIRRTDNSSKYKSEDEFCSILGRIIRLRRIIRRWRIIRL